MFMFKTIIIVKMCKVHVLLHMRQINNRDIHVGCLDVTNGSWGNLSMTH